MKKDGNYFDSAVREAAMNLLNVFLAEFFLREQVVQRLIAYVLFCGNLPIPTIETLTGLCRQTLYTIRDEIPHIVETGDLSWLFRTSGGREEKQTSDSNFQ